MFDEQTQALIREGQRLNVLEVRAQERLQLAIQNFKAHSMDGDPAEMTKAREEALIRAEALLDLVAQVQSQRKAAEDYLIRKGKLS
ncbi:hypothetical protein [Roseobacter phage RDJL6]|nr:hypothetical protein [Roseobacter phage RDJL6]